MSEPYLIAHIVRGSPAFDIAIKLEIGNEEGWIIPTSGHRAYPYWSIELNALAISDWPLTCATELPPEPPTDWPDHYSTDLSRDQAKRDAWEAREADKPVEHSALALSLGLVRPKAPIARRV